jgi:hypothetical protein
MIYTNNSNLQSEIKLHTIATIKTQITLTNHVQVRAALCNLERVKLQLIN